MFESEAERRKRQHQSEARVRKVRASWMPWTRHVPWMLVAVGPITGLVLGCVFAIFGAGAWGLIGPFAGALLHVTADLRGSQQRVRSKGILHMLGSATLGLAVIVIGVALVNLFSFWALTGVGWVMTNLGVWGLTSDVLLDASLVVMPPPKPSPSQRTSR
jgi:hypothetical protein